MTGAPVVVALTGGDGAFAIAPPMRGGQERANNGFSSPGFLSSEAQTASQRDVTLRFVYSAMHYHRHVDKDKYIKTRMFDVLFDRTQA